MPILGWKNHWPKLGIGLVKFEGHGKVPFCRVFDAHDAAALLHFVLRVDQQHGLPHMQFHLQFHESAVRVDDVCQGLDLLAFSLRVFRKNRDAHAQHDALAAAAVDRVGGTRHDESVVGHSTLGRVSKSLPNGRALRKEIEP